MIRGARTVVAGELRKYKLEDIMEVVALSRQILQIELSSVNIVVGEIRVKSGRVLSASQPNGATGLAAFRALLGDPGDEFKVRRLPPEGEYDEPLGTVAALFAGSDPTVPEHDPTVIRYVQTDEGGKDDVVAFGFDPRFPDNFADDEEELDETFVFAGSLADFKPEMGDDEGYHLAESDDESVLDRHSQPGYAHYDPALNLENESTSPGQVSPMDTPPGREKTNPNVEPKLKQPAKPKKPPEKKPKPTAKTTGTPTDRTLRRLKAAVDKLQGVGSANRLLLMTLVAMHGVTLLTVLAVLAVLVLTLTGGR